MTCRTLSPRGRFPARRDAFTLIELLTVIAIILVLAGLLLSIAGNANYKSAFARATAEIKALETALESYKADNGTYPRVSLADASVKSDSLNAQSDTEPTDAKYKTSGRVLYQTLSGYTPVGTTPPNKRYMEFKQGQLSTGSAAIDPLNTCVIDPFGFTYGYSTTYLAAQETANTNGVALTNPPGYNPTFDLWSTGGYSSSGKSYSKSGLAAAAYNTLWAKNW